MPCAGYPNVIVGRVGDGRPAGDAEPGPARRVVTDVTMRFRADQQYSADWGKPFLS